MYRSTYVHVPLTWNTWKFFSDLSVHGNRFCFSLGKVGSLVKWNGKYLKRKGMHSLRTNFAHGMLLYRMLQLLVGKMLVKQWCTTIRYDDHDKVQSIHISFSVNPYTVHSYSAMLKSIICFQSKLQLTKITITLRNYFLR